MGKSLSVAEATNAVLEMTARLREITEAVERVTTTQAIARAAVARGPRLQG